MRRSRLLVSLVLVSLLLVSCGNGGMASTTTEAEPPATLTTATTVAPTITTSSTAQPQSSTTTPESPGDLLVVGDWGSGTLPQGAVADAMSRYAEENDVAAILTTGDNFYSDDRDFLMQPFGWATEAEIPFWITWGNHDIESQVRIDAVNEVFDDPPRWAVYPWGRVDVIVLDSNQITSPEQAIFFLDSMADSSRPTVVVMHHPTYSCSRHGSTIDVVNTLVDILDEDVFLVLSGHDHAYQRFERDDITYVVTGGGGSSLYRLQDCPPSHPEQLAGAELHHFVVLQQSESDVELTAVDVNGDVIEQMSIPLPR